MFLPYEVPAVVSRYTWVSSSFYLEESMVSRFKADFMDYLNHLHEQEPQNSYDEFFQALIQGDMDKFLIKSEELAVYDYPDLMNAYQSLLNPELLSKQLAGLMRDLALLPFKLSQRACTQEELEAIIEAYPHQARRLLTLAYLAQAPLNWEGFLELPDVADLACLALAKEGKKGPIDQIYAQNPTLNNLATWCLLNKEEASPAMQSHPNNLEVVLALMMLGEHHMLLEETNRLLSINIDELHEGFNLIFSQYVEGRPSLSTSSDNSFLVVDPIKLERLIKAKFQFAQPCLFGKPRTPGAVLNLIQSAGGFAVEYYNLFARHHDYH